MDSGNAVTPVLEMKKITKRFPGVLANDQVDLTLYPGEIHALLGENGAGKSTLMNILTGIYFPNEGSILLNGEPADIKTPKDAVERGIGMVHQHFKLIEPLTVAENILLSSGRCRRLLKRRDMEEEVREMSEKFHLEVDPSAKIWQLSVGEQQRVEIVKQLFCGAEILILDEPTAVLTPQETVELFKTLRVMADEGKSILFITHKLFEVMNFADRITVLRGGRSMDTMLKIATDQDTLTKLMVGREVKDLPAVSERSAPGGPALVLENVSVMGDKGVLALRGLSLTVHKGEILGIAGVAGNGQRELCEVIAGLRKPCEGSIALNGRDITGISPRKAVKNGIGFIPEDRMGVGLVGTLDLVDNSMLRDFDSPFCRRHGILRTGNVINRAQSFVETYDIKNAGIHKPVSLMSGGNLQKLLIAREVNGEKELLIAAYPVHGVDIGATEAIHKILVQEREKGTPILLISEDLEELFKLSDRVAALSEGRVTGVVPMGQITQETYNEVGRLMLGHREKPAAEERGGLAQ